MDKTQVVAIVICTMALFVYCHCIANAQPNPEIKSKVNLGVEGQDKIEVQHQMSFLNKLKTWYKNTVDNLRKKSKADPESEPTNKSSFDFSMNGDKASRSVNLITTLPIDSLDGYVRGQLFYMNLKGNNDTLDKPRTSFSYMLQLEGNILPRIGGFITPRGHFEIENDPTIDTDPHLHLSVYDETSIKSDWLKGGLGFWVEFKELFDHSGLTGMMAGMNAYGIRVHADIEYTRKWGGATMEVEFLPRFNFDEFSVRTSPELKIDVWNSLSFRIIAEIDYYSENDYVTIEQFFDLFKPLDTSLAHLWSIEF